MKSLSLVPLRAPCKALVTSLVGPHGGSQILVSGGFLSPGTADYVFSRLTAQIGLK